MCCRYKFHHKTVLVNEYRFGVNDYREASDSLGDKTDDEHDSDDSLEDDHRPRRHHHHWEGRHDLITAHLVYNSHHQILWRLPYMILTCGGGAFFTLVIVLSIVFGAPMLLLESSLGQLTRSGPVRAMERVCSLGQGLGIAMSVLTYLSTLVTSVLTSWSLKLMVTSASVPPVWSQCDQVWSDNSTCVTSNTSSEERHVYQDHQLLGVIPALDMKNYFIDSPLEQYFYKRFLDQNHLQSDSFLVIRGEIAACLFVTWMWTYFCIWKRRKTTQISRHLQMFLLYIFILIPLVKFTIERSSDDGIHHLFIPKIEDLQNVSVWCCALGYVCNIFGLGYGVPMELAASNNFNYKHLLRDVIIITIINLIISVLVGVIVMLHANEIAVSKDISINDLGYNVEAVFLIIISGLSDLSFSQLYLISFFIIFFIIQLSTLFFQLDLVISAIQDNFWLHLNKFLKSREVLACKYEES